MSGQDARSFTQGPHAGRGPIGWTRTDARLAEAVSEAMSEDRLLDARGIEVTVEAGVVVLCGQVVSAADVLQAERVARRSGGAAEVRNELTADGVKAAPEPADISQEGQPPLPPVTP